jgi:NAD-dependent deacetylase
MATKPETTNEIKVDPKSLYLEEIFTDRRVGTIRRLTPVGKDGARDQGRAVLYVGETQVLTPAGALPIAFEIGAGSLEEAAEKFGQLAGWHAAHARRGRRRQDPDALIEEARSFIDAAKRVVVLTGAGISTDSGIPDFRGPQGLWTKNPLAEKMSNIHYYLADREVRKLAWQNRMASPAWTAKPNAGHLALVHLEKRQKLHALITQNIDELHQQAGNSRDLVIEVHGSMRRFMCWGCGMRGAMQRVLERVRAGEEDPQCRDCGGILKSDTISFGQQLVPEVIDRAMQVAGEADAFVAVGSTLQVYPVAGAVDIARAAGAKLIIVNAQPTAFDDVADALLPGAISEILPAILGSASRSKT